MFENIIGLHESSWKRLLEWRGKLPHALLLTGPKGIGKTELATTFIAGLLCESPRADGQGCKVCQGCHWFSQGNHPDFRLLVPRALQDIEESRDTGEKGKRGGQYITIDQVRELEDFCNVGTHRQGLRIILVHPAENLNHNAANALLKVLEEPPENTLFLLVSNEPLRLLATLRSRCQTLVINFPPAALAIQCLETAGVADPESWLALAGGAPEQAKALAGQMGGEWLKVLTQALEQGNRLEVLSSAAALEKILKSVKGENPLPLVVDCCQRWLVDMNLAAQGLTTRYYLQQKVKITGLAAKTSPETLTRLYQQWIKFRRDSEFPLNLRLFLEQLFFSYRAVFVE